MTKKRHTRDHMLVTSTRLVLDNAKNEQQYTITELKGPCLEINASSW